MPPISEQARAGLDRALSVGGVDESRLYLAVPHRGTEKAEIRVYEAR